MRVIAGHENQTKQKKIQFVHQYIQQQTKQQQQKKKKENDKN